MCVRGENATGGRATPSEERIGALQNIRHRSHGKETRGRGRAGKKRRVPTISDSEETRDRWRQKKEHPEHVPPHYAKPKRKRGTGGGLDRARIGQRPYADTHIHYPSCIFFTVPGGHHDDRAPPFQPPTSTTVPRYLWREHHEASVDVMAHLLHH